MAIRALVVDDAKFMRQTIRTILTGMGCDVIGEAADGIDACEKYAALKPDVVTMDVVMPKLSGIEALKRIRARDPNAKIVIVTAVDEREPLMEAHKLGAIDYVVKPFERERLEEALQRVTAE